MRFFCRPWRAGLLLPALLSSSPAFAVNPAEALEAAQVEVVGATPLPGLGSALRDTPAAVQIHTARQLRQQGQSHLAEYLEQQGGAVTVNAAQGNAFQTDVNFRGFAASPVLGAPQGLSVFQDGVRINEPFGDGVNWDLLPPGAISSIQLLPGTNPSYGLNTLGGALAIQTKSGAQHPGGALEWQAGSFGRQGVAVEMGRRHGDKMDSFIAADAIDDQGYARHNASRVRRFFGKLGWQDERFDLDVSFSAADNRLEGNQALPRAWLDTPREPYTWPDVNSNRMDMLAAKGSRYVRDDLIVGGNAYVRHYRNRNFSSNINDAAAGDPAQPQAVNDRASIDQDGYGLGVQATWLGRVAGMENQWVMGAAGDFGQARFTQDEESVAAFDASRRAVGAEAYVRTTDALARNAYYGLFAVDTLHVNERWTLTAAGRLNHARIRINDESGVAPALNGSHRFTRFSPALGANFNPSPALTAYVSLNSGVRMPTPIELTCADPDAPCKLPNNFLADPPLKPVIARTLEGGLRGALTEATRYTLALHQTELADDIQFIAANGAAANAGYFSNVGKTRRQGLELGLEQAFRQWRISADLSLLKATFESPFRIHAPANSSAVDGDIQVQPGNRIPGLPQQSLKLRVEYAWGEHASAGITLNHSGGVHARGDENNADSNGKIPGYSVLYMDARYRMSRDWEVFGRITNLTDRQYASMGVLGQNYFGGANRSFDAARPVPEQFRGLGAPRGMWLGLRYLWP